MKSTIIFTLVILFFTSCDRPTNSISRVTIASQDYMANAPFVAVEIDSSFNLKYYGGLNSDPIGFYRSKVSSSQWDTINSILESIQYEKMDSIYPTMVDDGRIEIVIYSKGKRKYIDVQPSRLKEHEVKVFERIINIYKEVKLIQTDDSLTFETNAQEFHPPIEQHIEFTPPPK